MSLLGRIDYKNANGDWIEATDSQMPEITTLLEGHPNDGVAFKLVINAQNQTYKNIGVYLTPASNLGDWRFNPEKDTYSNKNALLEFDDEAGLYIMRTEGDTDPERWEKFENGDLDADPPTSTKGRDYSSRIRIGKDFDAENEDATTYRDNVINFKLRFIPETGQELHNQENSRRWDRIFVGLEFEGEIHDVDS